MFRILLPAVMLGIGSIVNAQSISGFVMNENNEPVQGVNIFLKNRDAGTSSDAKGRYFLVLQPGEYDLIFSAIGYELYEVNVIIEEEPVTKNIWLKSSTTELEEIVVKASRKDPAYEIIQKVIEARKDSRLKSLRSDVYVKAIEIMENPSESKDSDKDEVISLQGEPLDPFEADVTERSKHGQSNMVEMNLVLNYQYPNQYKEERTGFKRYGNTDGLFIPQFSETDFNIYDNLLFLKGVSETAVVSPLSPTSILSYKYKLEEVIEEPLGVVYKIRVIPRKKGYSTVSGTLYVNDSLWNVNRYELSFPGGSLRFYDEFEVSQNYQPDADKEKPWISFRQAFSYRTTQGKKKLFRGNTVIFYRNIESDITFPDKFFSNEVAVITKEAFSRDSTYWNSTRPEPLTLEEQALVHYKDSIYEVVNSKPYKDSIQARYNKVTLGDVIYDGIGFRNYTKQETVYFSSLISLVDFAVVGGLRLGPYISYFKRRENGQLLYTSGSLNVGLKNADPQGNYSLFYRYLPFKLGDIDIRTGRSFQIVNEFDAYLNQLRSSNYILRDYLNVRHSIELFNGFYFRVAGEFSQRKSVEDYDSEWLLNEVIDGGEPLVFDDYEAFISDLSFSYTPAQRYMREPNYKRVLGSNFPTISVTYRKGWNGLFSSDIDFDYGELRIDQNVRLGILGSSWYTMRTGKFWNSRDLKFFDLRRFSESNPYLYSDPLNTFQLLDTTYTATDWFFEGHFTHHFNGALINNIPLIKKLRINTVAGFGALWIRENNMRYAEIHGGIERIFKLNARRRLRIGVYGVLSESNKTPVLGHWKIAFDLIDLWKKDWSY